MFHVLMALADGDQHGDAIIEDVRRRTDGHVALGAETLRALIGRLLAEAMILETERHYRLTPFGRDVAHAEVRRLESLIAQAKAKQLFCPTTKRGPFG